MLIYDRISTLFWIGVALFICIESIRLGVGSLSNPGPGLFPLGAGVVLGTFGLAGFIQTLGKWEEKVVLWRPGTQWWTLVSILLSLLSYGFLINPLGFFLTTFLWIGFTCRRIGKMGWKSTVFAALVTTISSYFLFEHYLGIRFPRGIFAF